MVLAQQTMRRTAQSRRIRRDEQGAAPLFEVLACPDGPRIPVQQQFPFAGLLELIRGHMERQESALQEIRAGQRSVFDRLKHIADNLPRSRRPLSRWAQEMHVRAISSRRNGLCPCCQESPVCTEAGRLAGAEFDHWYSRDKNRVHQTWLVCGACNAALTDTEFKAAHQAAFLAYQAALAPFTAGRQGTLFRS